MNQFGVLAYFCSSMMLRTYSGEFYLRRASSGELNLGSPLSNAAIRQRYNQGYASNDEDAEDGACSETSSYSSMHITLRPHTWTDIFQNIIWIVSASFIVYLGDCNTNLVSILLWDERIKRFDLLLASIYYYYYNMFFSSLKQQI